MAQFKRVWLPYKRKLNTDNSNGMISIGCYPTDDEKTEKASTEIQNLIAQGWRIVSTAPVTGSLNVFFSVSDDNDIYHTFTMGIEVFMVKE
jgi:hypothetical protein